MVLKGAQIPLGVGVQAAVQKLCDHFPLDL